MNYKNGLLGLLGLGVSLGAHAQFSTTIYGVLDAGVRYSDGLALSSTSSPSGSPESTTALANGVDRSGRWGFSGLEDLGGDYQALFTLESDLYINNGTTNPNIGTDKNTAAATSNKLFERQAFVGLGTPFGQVLLGRQQSVIRDIIDGIDAIDGRFTSFNPNLQYTALNSTGLVSSAATYYGSGDPGNGSMMRQDNEVKYIGSFGPVTGTLAYSFGGVAGASQDGSSTQAGLSYKDGPIALAGAYETLNNATNALKLTAYTVGGRLTEGDWKFTANYGSNTADTSVTVQTKTDVASIGTTYAATSAIDLTIGYYDVKRSWTNDAKPDATIHRVIGFAEYKFSPRTLVYLEVDNNQWGGDVTQFQGGAANKSSTSGLTIGINHKI
jgi:predicted porin